uniref:Uncharacterized protein n=1 Tax=Glossina austeni TaxID=7395 RepID=A0A1A9UHK2_GLOAU
MAFNEQIADRPKSAQHFEEVRRHVRNFKKVSNNTYSLQYFEVRASHQSHRQTKETLKRDLQLSQKYLEGAAKHNTVLLATAQLRTNLKVQRYNNLSRIEHCIACY